MQLSKKTILITGGSSGIGFELARQLIGRGNTVIVTGRDLEKLHAAKRALPQLHIMQSDVSDVDAIAALHEKVLAQFPTLNVLINNAGIMRNLDLNDTRHDVASVTREIAINLCGPLYMVQQFLPHLKTQNEAAIINVSSGLAFVPFPSSPVYSATKAGLHSYSQALRVQLHGSNVTVIELAPPGTDTPLFTEEFKEEVKDMKAMDVKVLATHAIKGIEAGKLEIRPGLSNVLKLMSRLAPQFMLNQLAKSYRPLKN